MAVIVNRSVLDVAEITKREEGDQCMNELSCANCLGPRLADNKDECVFYKYCDRGRRTGTRHVQN